MHQFQHWYFLLLLISILPLQSEKRGRKLVPPGKIVVLNLEIPSQQDDSRSRMSQITARNHRAYAKLNNYTFIHSTKLLDDSRWANQNSFDE